MSGLNIVFAGTPEFGVPCLDALIQSKHHLKAIYSQPDRPAGRGRKLQASAVKEWAIEHNIPVYQPINFKSQEAIDELIHLKPDVLIVIAYGLILPRAVLEIPRLGCINVHASLLPRWRGASPIQHALLYGDAQSGVTIMQMDVGMDTGDMLCKVALPLSNTDTAGTLHDKLAQISAQPLLATLEDLQNGQAKPEVQNNELATYASKINKEDALINWNKPAVEIDRLIRAFNPWPIAYTTLGDDILRIHEAQVSEKESSEAPGTIISLDKTGMLVATGAHVISQGEKAARHPERVFLREGSPERGTMQHSGDPSQKDAQDDVPLAAPELLRAPCVLVKKIQFPGAKAISVGDWLNSGKTQLHVGLVL